MSYSLEVDLVQAARELDLLTTPMFSISMKHNE